MTAVFCLGLGGSANCGEVPRVIVVGGGMAGATAAVAAARRGAKVTLIERGICAGGLGTSGLVPCFTPLSYKSKPIVGGIFMELYEQMKSSGATSGAGWPSIDAERTKKLWDDFFLKEGIEVRYLTQFFGVVHKGRRISGVKVLDASGEHILEADNFIDATGDASLAFLAGVPTLSGDADGNTQACSCNFVMAGVNFDKMEANDLKLLESGSSNPSVTTLLKEYVKRFLENGWLANSSDFDFHVAGANADIAAGVVRVNFGHFYGYGKMDASLNSKLMMEGRKRVFEYLDCLRKHVKGFEHAIVVSTPSLPDIRETRRIVGRMTVTAEDFWQSRTHEDDIAIYDYGVDVHRRPDKTKNEAPFGKAYQDRMDRQILGFYGVPWRILLTNEYDNLAVVGRCVSATQDMLGALRVMPCAAAMGQAAGTAAALKAPLADIDVQTLRKELSKDGVILEYDTKNDPFVKKYRAERGL